MKQKLSKNKKRCQYHVKNIDIFSENDNDITTKTMEITIILILSPV